MTARRSDISTYVAVVFLLAAATFTTVAVMTWQAPHQPLAIVLFAAAFVIVQLLPVPIPRGNQLEMVRFEEAVVVPMVLALQPIDALIAISLGVLGGHLFSRAPAIKTVFNVSQLVLATAACLGVVTLIAGSAPGPDPRAMAAAVIGLVGMFLINQLLVAGVMSRVGGVQMHGLLFEELGLKGLMWSANAALGLMLVLPLFEAPWLLLVSFVPLAFLHASYRAYVDRAHEEERLRTLQHLTRGITRELSLEHTARNLVDSARELVGAQAVELVMREDERMFWSRLDDDVPVSGATPVDDALPNHDDQHEFTVPLSGRTGLSGVLRVYHDRPSGPASRIFSTRDRTLLEMLVRHAETALDNALLFARATSQRRKFAQIFDHSSEGLLVLSETGRVLSWNPAMSAIAHFAAEDVLDSPIALLSPQLATITESTTAGAIDAVLSTADGSRRQVRASYAPIQPEHGSNGDASAWVIVVRDITRERETERLKDDFVATVSHELRTPLTAIKGFLDTMRREDVAFEPAQVGMFLDIMSEQSDRLERLISDLLDMSAIESGRPLKVSIAPVELHGEVHRAVQGFEAARPEAQVVIHDCPIPLMVDTDRHRLQQIITNLLENACKHAGSSGPIELSLHERDEVVQLRVRDHGPGISAADIRHIFDRFYLTSDSVTRTGGGAGLGLYICRKLLDAMGGTIDVASTVGEGSTFTVSMPAVRSSGGSEPRRRSSDRTGDDERALEAG